MAALHETLGELGVAVDLIEPVPGLPDLVFTANAGLVYRDLFIRSRFRYGVRQGEHAISSRGPRAADSRSSTCPTA